VKKALIVTSVASMIDQFLMNDILVLKELGYKVHVAANFKKGNTNSQVQIKKMELRLTEMGVKYSHINFSRNVFNLLENYYSYVELNYIVKNKKIDLIHCHSPIGGVIGRVVAKKYNISSLYTAHGFHFFKGSSVINWIAYFPVEYLLSKITKKIITINREDYYTALKYFNSEKIEYINGVGINLNEFSTTEITKESMRDELDIDRNCFLLLSVGELNKNKNHEVVIKSLQYLKEFNVQYAICGKGPLKESLVHLANELGVSNQVHFLGFRPDVKNIYSAADVYVFPSFREGLSVALMEAMASSLPVICSKIRGNTDLIQDGKGGTLIQDNDPSEYKRAIIKLYNEKSLRNNFANFNKQYIEMFDEEIVKESMREIYQKI